MNKILIVEDNPDIRTLMKFHLSKEFTVFEAWNKASALRLLDKRQPPVVILNLGLPPDENGSNEGFACLREILTKAPETKVIIVTGNKDGGNALEAVRMGAYDYYIKPIDMNKLKVIIERAFYLSEIEDENRNLSTLLNKDIGFDGMIGQCSQMLNVFETILKVSIADTTILVTGESGTGKKLAAKIIHKKSLRNKEDFIFINCGDIPEKLLGSEIFNGEKKVSLNANNQQGNKFKGTLFLDEISKMSLEYQTRLSGFLERERIQQGRGNQDGEIDIRIIATSNVDLQEAIKEGKFREGLFYRLSVITINLPPLRERGQDIMLLANVFLERYKAAVRKKIRGFSHEAVNAIKIYSWPGNIMELESKIEKAIIMSDSKFIEPYALGLAEAPVTQIDKKYEDVTLKEARKRLEIELIEMNISKYKGNIKRVAKELGISRPTLYELITKYGLNTKYTLDKLFHE